MQGKAHDRHRPSGERSRCRGIAAIYNDAVINTTAIWNDVTRRSRPIASCGSRRAAKQAFPVLVAEEDGAIVGYGSFGDFRAFDGYRFSVEHSVYVAEGMRRRGIASALIDGADRTRPRSRKHVMIAGIAADNDASVRLHAKLGFAESGASPRSASSSGAGSTSSSCRRRFRAAPASSPHFDLLAVEAALDRGFTT